MVGGPSGATQSADMYALVEQESSRFNLPLWLTWPLVQAEGASTGQNLLQIQPGYPGSSGANLNDPKTSLDLGFTQLSAYYQAHPNDQKDSLSNFEDIISHSGFAVWNGWSSEPSDYQRNYESKYNAYHSTGGLAGQTVQGALNNAGAGFQAGLNAAAGSTPLGPVGSFIESAASGIVGNPADAISNPAGWVSSNGWKIVVVLVAMLIMTGMAFRIVDKAPPQIIKALP